VANSTRSFSLLQAKDALKHPYFDDLDFVAVNALENPALNIEETF
jgi:hypothetical protein